MKLSVRSFYLMVGLAAGRLAAQVAGPSPLVSDVATSRLAPGNRIEAEGQADRALQTGFCATAATMYGELLRDPALPAESRPRITLARVSALMDAGDLGEAEAELRRYDGPINAGYHLRVGLLAASARRFAQARAALNASKLDDLPVADRGWWHYLQALVAEADNDRDRRFRAYAEAIRDAVSELQRVRFQLGQESSLLRTGPATEQQLAAFRATMEKFAGQGTGYDATRSYAVALATMNRKIEALAVLQRQLAGLPPSQHAVADQTLLLIGLIAGEDSPVGRKALSELVARGYGPETQRVALSLLARGAKTPEQREEFRRDLSDLISAPTEHPIIEDLLLARAQAALIDKDYPRAEEDAGNLLDRYPGTPLKAAALGVRLSVAWDSKRYRAAADVIAQLRATLPDGHERAELGVLLAEAFFRAGELSANPADDYRSAADAYDAALGDPPAGVKVGTLIFQRVLSDIRAGGDRLEAAARQLDEEVTNPGFDPESRWQAEWNLVKEMQVRGQAQQAYQRVDRLLSGGAAGAPPELRIRLMWLRAKLSFDNNQFAQAQRQADELLDGLKAGGLVDAALGPEVTATAMLLKAQALFALDQDQAGYDLLTKLRAGFHATSAAKYSYLVQANHLTLRGEMTAAQGVLQNFVDDPEYQNSEYAPLALFEIALILERQGLDRQLVEANTKLELLIKNYPDDRLVFYARLKQGDLMRKLNEFPRARLIYEDLVNNHAGHPDILLAHLALADTYFAQGANSVSNYESAVTIYERLRDLPAAPVDLRAEAGFKLGYALAKRALAATDPTERDQQLGKAQGVYWSLVDDFLLHPAEAAKLGAKGRYWVARALLELGQINEDAGRLDEAQHAYQLIVDQKLSGASQAQAKLARLRNTGGTKP